MQNKKYMLEIIMKTEEYNQSIIKLALENNLKLNKNTSETILQFLDNNNPRDFGMMFMIPKSLSKQNWFMENVESIKFFKNSENGFLLKEDILSVMLRLQSNL